MALLLLGNWNLGMLESGHRGKLAYGNWAYGIRACGLLAYGILAYLYNGHIHLEYQGSKQGGPRGHPLHFFHIYVLMYFKKPLHDSENAI